MSVQCRLQQGQQQRPPQRASSLIHARFRQLHKQVRGSDVSVLRSVVRRPEHEIATPLVVFAYIGDEESRPAPRALLQETKGAAARPPIALNHNGLFARAWSIAFEIGTHVLDGKPRSACAEVCAPL